MSRPITPSRTTRLASEDDIPALTAGLNDAFTVQRTEAWVRWRFFDRPAGARNWVLEVEGEIVGHLALEPHDTWIDRERERVHTAGYLFTAPDWRGRDGVADLIAACRADDPAARWLGFPFERSLIRLRPGRDDANRFTQWVRWYSGAAVARSAGAGVARLAQPVAAAAVRVQGLAARWRVDLGAVRPGFGPSQGHDELAARSSAFARAVRIRDWTWLEWRWVRSPDRVDAAHALDDTGQLMGYVVWRQHPVGGKGEILDLLADEPATAAALAHHAGSQLRQIGTDLVVVDLVDRRPGVDQALRAAGFLSRGLGPPVLPRQPPGQSELPPTDWFLTLADTDHV